MTVTHDALYEQVATRRHGQSEYAPEGERSKPQREHDVRAFMDLLQRVSFAAGRAEGYAAGFDKGHRQGRHEMARFIGLKALADAIEREYAAIRRELDR